MTSSTAIDLIVAQELLVIDCASSLAGQPGTDRLPENSIWIFDTNFIIIVVFVVTFFLAGVNSCREF